MDLKELQQVAQAIVDDLAAQRQKSQENVWLLDGAIQGVNLLFNKVAEHEQRDINKKEADLPTAAEKGKPRKKSK